MPEPALAPQPGQLRSTSAPITSSRHPRVTAARRLSRPAARRAERRFLVEGPQAVREALGAGGLHELFLTAEAAGRHPGLAAEAAGTGAAVHVVSGAVLAEMADTVTPQGVVGVAPLVDRALDDAVAPGSRLVAVLADVRDPGNAGTVIRGADAAGADAVVLTAGSVDVHNGKCVRSTAGSLFHLPVTTGATLPAALARLREVGCQVLAADGHAGPDLDDLLDDRVPGHDLRRPTAWVFGNEAWGLPVDLLAAADLAVRVPVHGRAESLNLAAAAAVCLYASARAQRSPGGCRV